MSVQSLYTAATGMTALETKLDVIANNLANVNTTAFKKDRANFEDLFYRHEVLPGAQDAQGNFTPDGIHVGLGVRVQSVQPDFGQGAFDQTNRELDVAIEGQGFFTLIDPTSGEVVYSRAGNFTRNANNQLVMGSAGVGRLVEPGIQFPDDTTAITISPDGTVTVTQAGGAVSQVGQFQLALFPNPEGMLKVGENLYLETQSSGAPQLSTPGSTGLGVLRQNSLELSNVEPVRELIDLITTQRSFELNSQAVQAGDQVLQLIANLRRF